jgi:hypothetical protein
MSSVRVNAVYRWVTLGSLALGILVCGLGLILSPILGLMATDSGVNARTISWAAAILITPLVVGAVLVGAVLWLERHRSAYPYVVPIVALGWAVALVVLWMS